MNLDPFVISQAIGLISFIAGILSFQFKKRADVLRCWCVADMFNSAHFYLLDRPEAATLLLISASRFLVASFTTDKKFFYLYLLLTASGFAWSYQSPVSILIFISGMLGTYGTFNPADIRVRIALFGCSLLWVTHNTIVGSPVAVIMESCYLVSNLIGLWRYYRHLPIKFWGGRTG